MTPDGLQSKEKALNEQSHPSTAANVETSQTVEWNEAQEVPSLAEDIALPFVVKNTSLVCLVSGARSKHAVIVKSNTHLLMLDFVWTFLSICSMYEMQSINIRQKNDRLRNVKSTK